MLFSLFDYSFLDYLTILLLLFILALVSATSANPAVTLRPKHHATAAAFINNGTVTRPKSDVVLRGHDEDRIPTSSSPESKSPPSSARHSYNNTLNGNYDDEYHEDEDTLSLENLFPGDQSELYKSKKIKYIIEELLQTEVNYVKNLKKGLENYGRIQESPTLPPTLQGAEKQKQLLGNIEQILELHQKHVLPMMQRHQTDLKQLFDEFSSLLEKDNFYCYVSFTMNKTNSIQLRQEHRDWFQKYQDEIKDKLGIDSFLVQPIQRLTRYPLLLQQLISEFYKSGFGCKPVLMSVCKLETKTRRLLEVVNQSEEIHNIDDTAEFDIREQGFFRKATEFDALHLRTRKKYRAKVYLFDRGLVCVEVRKKRLSFKHFYPWSQIDVQSNNSKSITLLQMTDKGGLREEYEFSAPEAISVSQWMRCTQTILDRLQEKAAYEGKLTVPMDVVLAVVAGLWFIYQTLWYPKIPYLF